MISEGSILTPFRLAIGSGQSESGSPSSSYESELGMAASKAGEFSRDFPSHPRASFSALRAARRSDRSSRVIRALD